MDAFKNCKKKSAYILCSLSIWENVFILEIILRKIKDISVKNFISSFKNKLNNSGNRIHIIDWNCNYK